MGDDERQDIGRRVDGLSEKVASMMSKLDRLSVFIETNRDQMENCQMNCKENKKDVWNAINEIRLSKFNPAWLYAGGIVLLVVLDLMKLVRG